MGKYTIISAYKALRTGIEGYLFKDNKGRYLTDERDRLPFYLEGLPGVGKTQIVREIADELNIGFVSYSLTHHTRNTVLGLPVIGTMDDGSKYTSYTISEILESVMEKVQAGEKEGILLLDEFPCMSESVVPIMLSFLQNKVIGRHKLPEGWVIVLCGNPGVYNRSVRSFDAATLDRVRKLEIEYSEKDFLAYAKDRALNPAIADFIEINPQYLFVYSKDAQKSELVTARGWENLSKTLEVFNEMKVLPDLNLIYQFIKSENVSIQFEGFLKQYQKGFSNDLIRRVLEDEYSEDDLKTFSDMAVRSQWRFVDYVYKYIDNEAPLLKGVDECEKEFATKTGNLLVFLEKCKVRDSVYLRVFKMIQKNNFMIKAMVNYPQESYKRLCKRTYSGG